jgi:tetratricopeptide (TPR) repeat protein
LVEPLARLRLAQGDPETALRMIETCRTPPASLRMLRATCLLFLGSRTEAHHDLYRWSARASAPLDARLLLGLMERDGKDATAVRTLLRNLRHLEDPRTLQALLLISTQRGRPEQAEVWAGRLRNVGRSGSEGAAEISDLMLQSLGMPGLGADAESTTDQANALAMELITFEPAITTLTEAQHRRPHLPTAYLLVRAIEQALPDLADQSSAMHAMARLSVLLGEYEVARDWAQRGLAANPMSAALVLLVNELGGGPTPPEPSGVVSVFEPQRESDEANRTRRAAA